MSIILDALLGGVAATVTMDLLTGIARRFRFAEGAKGAWVGRWYLGMLHGRWVHADISTSPECRGEKTASLAGHYMIGTVLAAVYVHGAGWLGLSPESLPNAVGFGIATVIFPLFLVYPGLGFGCCGRRVSQLKPLQTSYLSHIFYGIGLWWSMLVFMK
ncbi:DUF2938 domain-containing protein [bacterium]|nr:DUF2938 domain-containing protein [bacterium]